METYHIHIKGVVQGVGFRPFVYRTAKKYHLKGSVNNTTSGVHILINSDKKNAESFLKEILDHLPPLAKLTGYELVKTEKHSFQDFQIVQSKSTSKPNVLLTPDAAICPDCKEELYSENNRRFQYPFITCTNCGPRYSIISKLPYDRPNTTMDPFEMCDACQQEYHDPLNRRHYSQTNSCPDCKIEMQLYEHGVLKENFTDLDHIVNQWRLGKIIAIKGIGGYLLTCDATNWGAISTLRNRKHRPVKPFALMYPDLETVRFDVELSEVEKNELESIYAPIVLLRLKKSDKQKSKLALEEINRGLHRIGIMLPYTPLYDLLLKKFKKPVIATSGNITDSTIIFKDDEAIQELSKIADIILLNDREILIPQDDGVVQFTAKNHQKITLRRSRGKAPVYINSHLEIPEETVLATGSMLKSVFGFLNQQNIYVSQFLGNTAGYHAQENYIRTFKHFTGVFETEIDTVITDKHPDYFSTRFGKEIAGKNDLETYELQHHKAHFYSVLGEHNLLDSEEKILGVVWDGTGLGDDGNIWGGEFFGYRQGKMERIFHLDEFDYILGDKMAKEPKISAMAILHSMEAAEPCLKEKFTETEWKVYKTLLRKNRLKSTSMGRLFDAVSSVLFNFDMHRFEAEASMKLEKEASEYFYSHQASLAESYLYNKNFPDNFIDFLFENIFSDLNKDIDKQYIAVRFHITLVDYIIRIARKYSYKKIAFSGGVFQNALLADLITDHMKNDFELFFQIDFSPNDEGIPFGQLMYYTTGSFRDKE
jgi:hydrogenase maturation protein HypF